MNDEFDYLVIGGGSAGSAVAGRLSEHPEYSVCVLEAGGPGSGPLTTIPAALVLTAPRRLNNWAFETVPQAGLGGRLGYQPRGKVLGGSSAINAMVYVRGHAQDYDHWAALGNTGWSYAEVLPYFKKSECNERFHDEWHGNTGPQPVGDLRTDNPFIQRWIEAGRQAGLPITDDFNGAQQEGIGTYQVTQKEGERWSAARSYLLPHLGSRANLTVKTGAHTQRIIFEAGRAVAVEIRQGGRLHVLRARREIIVAAGALQSPQLLMLSGIGDAAQLQRFGIAVQQHLPGVGRNLQDHPDFVFGHESDSLDTIGISLAGTLRTLREIGRFRRERRGMLTTNYAEGGGFLKTDPGQPVPNVQLHFVVALLDDHGRKTRLGHGISCHVCLLRPRSRGTVALQSPDPQAAPLIDPNFLGDPADLEDMVAAFKLTRTILQTPALAAWLKRDVFTAQARTDDDIRALLRQRVDSVYHPVGTCRMGVDELAVVDPELRVRGVQGLRIVDASIMPTIIGGNTNAPSMMIGEKAADMILAAARADTAAHVAG
jgi:choline dehydrogenase-like flavoprotein